MATLTSVYRISTTIIQDVHHREYIQYNITVAFIIKNLINPISPSETFRIHNQLQICSEASEKNPTSGRDFCKPHPWHMWCKCSNRQFQMANHRDWGIMGYNDVIVCITVINLMNAFFSHRTGSISSEKSISIGFLIMSATSGTPSHSYGVSLAICVLPATRHKWTHVALTPAR